MSSTSTLSNCRRRSTPHRGLLAQEATSRDFARSTDAQERQAAAFERIAMALEQLSSIKPRE
jgi:hypothetical protein